MAKNTETTESKASYNVVEIIGRLKENKLTIEKGFVGGSLVIQWGKAADQQTEVKVYVASKNKNGDPKKAHAKLVALNDTMISASKATEDNPATVLIINGKGDFTPHLQLNEYNSNGTILSNPEASLSFGNIGETTLTDKDFKGEFDVDIFLTKKPIIKDEKLIVDGVYVDYEGKVKPLTFSVEDDDLISGIEECKKGETVNIWGDIKIASIVENKTKSSGFGGKAKTETNTLYTKELVITGGNPIDEEDKRAIDSGFVKKALVERETFLEELKKEDSKTAPKKPTSFGGKASKDIDDDDLPF